MRTPPHHLTSETPDIIQCVVCANKTTLANCRTRFWTVCCVITLALVDVTFDTTKKGAHT